MIYKVLEYFNADLIIRQSSESFVKTSEF